MTQVDLDTRPPGTQTEPRFRRVRSADPRSIARRRRLVAIARTGLPVTALALLALLAVWPELDRGEESLRLSYRQGEPIPADLTRVVGARLAGTDEEGRPYTVTASEARQRPGEEQVLLLEPRGDLTLSNGHWLMVEAEQGQFWQKTGRLELGQGVRLWHDAGWHLETRSARIDLRGKTADGSDAVTLQGPMGELQSTGFRIEQAGDVVLFQGPARALLNLAEQAP